MEVDSAYSVASVRRVKAIEASSSCM